MATKNPVSKAVGSAPSSLKLVIYGQGSTENRGATLLRISDRLREELAEVAQGQLYLVIEYALRKLIDDLKERPAGNMVAVSAADMVAEPARASSGAPKRAPRAKKAPAAKKA